MATPIDDIKKEFPPCPLDPDEIKGFLPTQESDLNVSRTNKFILVMSLPRCMGGLKSSSPCSYINLQKLQMAVHGKTIPEISIEHTDVPVLGHGLKVSSYERKGYNPVTVKFTVDSKFENYYVIYQWLNMLNDSMEGGFTPKGKGNLHHYSTTFSLYTLQEYNVPTVRWDYYYAFPTNLGSITLDKRNPEIIECDFTFAFSFINMTLLP